MAVPRYLVVFSERDPVAVGVADRWETGTPTGQHVDGAPIRELPGGIATLRRPGLHIFDERLDLRLPEAWREGGIPIVFPSVHRSERGDDALTVHPLGNPSPTAEVGGRPGVLNPAAPRWMTDALRRLGEGSGAVGLPATFEATHHGPELGVPSFFIEVGGKEPEHPPAPALDLISRTLRELEPDEADLIVVGAGGGHYAPHFTDLARKRKLAFGHMLPRHALESLTPALASEAWRKTPGASGVLYARASDVEIPATRAWGRRVRENEAARRDGASTPTTTSADARSAGT